MTATSARVPAVMALGHWLAACAAVGLAVTSWLPRNH